MNGSKTRPRTRDRLNREAGWMLKRCASAQNMIAMALKKGRSKGWSECWVSQQIHGDNTGAVQRFYNLVHDLAAHTKTDPSHLLVGAMLVMEDAYRQFRDDDLHTGLFDVLRRETTAQAEEDQASWNLLEVLGRDDRDDEALRIALDDHQVAVMAEVACEITSLVMGRELSRRLAGAA